MRMQQNVALCNREKRCLPWDGPGRRVAGLPGGSGTGPSDGLGSVKSRPNSLLALYSSVQQQGSLPKPLAANHLRSRKRLCRHMKCPKMSGFDLLGKRCFWVDRVRLSPFAPRKCELAHSRRMTPLISASSLLPISKIQVYRVPMPEKVWPCAWDKIERFGTQEKGVFLCPDRLARKFDSARAGNRVTVPVRILVA